MRKASLGTTTCRRLSPRFAYKLSAADARNCQALTRPKGVWSPFAQFLSARILLRGLCRAFYRDRMPICHTPRQRAETASGIDTRAALGMVAERRPLPLPLVAPPH